MKELKNLEAIQLLAFHPIYTYGSLVKGGFILTRVYQYPAYSSLSNLCCLYLMHITHMLSFKIS